MIRIDWLPMLPIIVLCALALGCKDKPAVYACIAENGGTCEERYGETQEDADGLCVSGNTFQVGTCPTRNLIGRCEKPGTALGKETYVVKSYYLPMPEGWDVNRMQTFCAKGQGRWLAPGAPLSVPGELLP